VKKKKERKKNFPSFPSLSVLQLASSFFFSLLSLLTSVDVRMGSWCEICEKDVEQSAKVHARVHQDTVELKNPEGKLVTVKREGDGFSCPFCPPNKVTVMANADSLRKHVSRTHLNKEKIEADTNPHRSPVPDSPEASTTSARRANRQIREEDGDDDEEEEPVEHNGG